MPMINGIPTPSALLSTAHNAYGHLSTTITNMTAPLDHEEELWPQFEVSAQSVTDACKKYVELVLSSTVALRTHAISLMKVRGELGRTNKEVH
jgi:hypothetical protein